MKSSFQFVSLFVVSVVGYASAAKLPPTFDICKRGPTFDPCVERAIEKALTVLVDGYPPLGILSVDPLEITTIVIDQGSGPVSINLKFRNLKIKGLRNVKISDMKTDMNNLKFSGKLTIPGKVLLDGLYTIDGKVLILPIKGDGVSHLGLDDVTGEFSLTGKQFQKKGMTYMRVTSFDFNIQTKKLAMQFSNLFNGDKVLGDNMNRFLNENSAEIFNELKPAIQETFGAAFAEISNRIFTKVPFDEVFLK